MNHPLIASSLMKRCGQTGRCERLCWVKLARLKPPGGMAPERASCGLGAVVPKRLTPADHTDSVGPLFPSLCHPGTSPDSPRPPKQRALPTLHFKAGRNHNTHRLDPILKELQRLECKINVKSSNRPEHNAFSVSPA